MAGKPWYRDGLRFKCTACGDCCTGAPGFVWINQDELEALAAAIGTSDLDDFERLYVRKVGIRRSLREFPNGDCVFFDADSRKCQVYQARPRQCRTWPFWSSNLKSAEAWEETCRVCPGSGKGKLYQLEQIEAQRKVIKV
jgi:Fe-S-cluster containining protein